MKVKAAPQDVVPKTELRERLKNIKPGQKFDRMLVVDRSKVCCVILSIDDWNAIIATGKELRAKARIYDALVAMVQVQAAAGKETA